MRSGQHLPLWRRFLGLFRPPGRPDGSGMGDAIAAAGGPPVPARLTPRSVWDCSVEDILNLSEDLRTGEECSEAVRQVLRLDPRELDPALLDDGERALPSEPRFLESGYSRMMLARCLVPGALHCRGRLVLETGCGLRWGALLLSRFAARVVAFDRDPHVVDFARRTWPAENIEWLTGDVLDESFLAGRRFDVITAMETIEHLQGEDSERYVAWMASRLEPTGW